MFWRMIQMVCCRCARLGLAVLLFSLPVAAVTATAAVRTVALSGQNPFSSGEVTGFGTFYSRPAVNNRGQVAFTASLVGGGVPSTQDSGLWVANGAGSFETVAREGSPAAGFPEGSLFGSFPDFNFTGVPLDDAGRVAFVALAAPPASSFKYGVWAGDGGGVNLQAMQGAAAPGAVGDATYILSSIRPTLSRNGKVAFQTNLNAPYTSPPNNGADGVWRGPWDGAVQLAALINESAVGLGAAAKFTDFRSLTSQVPVNRAGTAAFHASYTMADGATTSGSGVWVSTGAGLALRAWTNMPAPELGAAALASVSALGGVDGAGNVAFKGSYGNAEVGPGKGSLIGVAGDGGLSVVAYTGGLAPGAGVGHTFSGMSYEPSINSAGDVAFYANERGPEVSSPSMSGVWVGQSEALAMVAREGDAAPGTGANFGRFIRDTPAINRFGQVAFVNSLVGAPAGTSSTLWATDLEGQAVLVARQGEMLEVAPGDVRTISTLDMITFHGDDDGRARSFNDLGQVAIRATFSDSTSGIFLSNVVAHLPGDYNDNGVVDTADFTVWRDALTSQNLAADGTLDGSVDAADYDLWKEFFGVSLDLAGGSGALAVPEPGTGWLVMWLIAAIVCSGSRRRSTAEL